MDWFDSGTMHSAQRSPQRSTAVLERDAALSRVGRIRRLVLFGTAALSAAFAALVSTTPLGKASTRTSRAPSTTARGSTPVAHAPSLPPLAGANQLGLQGPAVAPSDGSGASAGPTDPAQAAPSQDPSSQPAPAPQPPVVSGGS
jgi:hypothetical protein